MHTDKHSSRDVYTQFLKIFHAHVKKTNNDVSDAWGIISDSQHIQFVQGIITDVIY